MQYSLIQELIYDKTEEDSKTIERTKNIWYTKSECAVDEIVLENSLELQRPWQSGMVR